MNGIDRFWRVGLALALFGLAGCGSDGERRTRSPGRDDSPQNSTRADSARQTSARQAEAQSRETAQRNKKTQQTKKTKEEEDEEAAAAEAPPIDRGKLKNGAAAAENAEGITALQKENYPLAAQHFQKAVVLNPAEGLYRNNLGRTLCLAGDYGRALGVLLDAQEIAPGDARIKANLADVFRRLGRPEEGIRYYREAIRLDPNFTEAHYELGDLYLKLGRYDSAELRLRQALKLDPKHDQATLALVILYHLTKRDELAWRGVLDLEGRGFKVQSDLRRAIIARLPNPLAESAAPTSKP